jgi:hypothetical protein
MPTPPNGAARVRAGLDVGNATTEVVLVDASADPPLPLAHDRAATRGVKGSARANEGAALLAARLARRHGLRIDEAVVTGQRHVRTTSGTVTEPPPDTAPLVLLAAAGRTPGRPGFGAGVPTAAEGPPRPGPDVVLVVGERIGYDEAAAAVTRWLADPGAARVAAVLVHRDEGVLVARRVPRLPAGVPVLDAVGSAPVLALPRVAVEVAPDGEPVQRLADPLRLVATFTLDGGDRQVARVLAGSLADARGAVVGLDPLRGSPGGRSGASGSAPAPALDELLPPADDLGRWAVDLVAAGATVEARTSAGRHRHVVTARIAPPPAAAPAARGAEPAPEDVAAALLGVPVARLASEAAAARAGALTTPGAAPDAVVLDLGGGTLDLAPADAPEIVAAGAGDLVTAAVAAALGISRGAADWVKRGPCHRLEGPHVLLAEDGGRRFAERAAPGDAVGSLVVPGPAGWLPFARDLAPAEWRALRLRLKRAALGDNLARLVAALPGGLVGRDVVLVGGVAGDPEILRVLDRALAGATVGRADVAGSLGHRWAVAYGLTLLPPSDPPRWPGSVRGDRDAHAG